MRRHSGSSPGPALAPPDTALLLPGTLVASQPRQLRVALHVNSSAACQLELQPDPKFQVAAAAARELSPTALQQTDPRLHPRPFLTTKPTTNSVGTLRFFSTNSTPRAQSLPPVSFPGTITDCSQEHHHTQSRWYVHTHSLFQTRPTTLLTSIFTAVPLLNKYLSPSTVPLAQQQPPHSR
jgi:hypothetical protein